MRNAEHTECSQRTQSKKMTHSCSVLSAPPLRPLREASISPSLTI
jgi:hypothetical protein